MKQSATKKKKFIDSCGWIETLADGNLAEKYAPYIENTDPENSFTSPIVFYEIYKRLIRDWDEETAIQHLISIQQITTMVQFTPELAIDAAELSIGEKIPMADAIILASARQEKAQLITHDKHLEKYSI